VSFHKHARRSAPMSTAEQAVGRPRPRADEASEQYWAAAREHRLMFPFCTTCRRWFHPVSHLCPNGHETSEYRELSGRGTVYGFTTLREQTTLGLDPPYVVALITLCEQEDLCLIANLVELGDRQPAVDMPVEVTYEAIAPDCTLPQFRPSGGG
jgi:uncharacterized OB-fold protein